VPCIRYCLPVHLETRHPHCKLFQSLQFWTWCPDGCGSKKIYMTVECVCAQCHENEGGTTQSQCGLKHPKHIPMEDICGCSCTEADKKLFISARDRFIESNLNYYYCTVLKKEWAPYCVIYCGAAYLFGIRCAIDLFYSSKNFWCPPPLLLLLSSWVIAPQPFILCDFEPTFVKQL
jgi:hypothetical protein